MQVFAAKNTQTNQTRIKKYLLGSNGAVLPQRWKEILKFKTKLKQVQI